MSKTRIELIIAIAGVIIAALALIPAFGQWLFPLPITTSTAMSTQQTHPQTTIPTTPPFTPSLTVIVQPEAFPTPLINTPTITPLSRKQWIADNMLTIYRTPNTSDAIVTISSPGTIFHQTGEDVTVQGTIWRPIVDLFGNQGWVIANELREN